MIYRLASATLVTSLLLFTSCAHLEEEKKVTPKQKKESHVKKLNKEVTKLDSHDKQLIYRTIKNEINLHKKRGDEDYKHGYYHDAIKAYELVNFYEGYSAVPLKKINFMKKKAKKRSISHYKQAEKYLQQGKKKKALIELNTVMMNNPNYKESKKLYNKIKNQRDMKIYINELETALEEKLVNNKGSYRELKAIKHDLYKLVQYDYKNKSAKKAEKLLKQQEPILLQDAIASYKQKKLKTAKQKFYRILSLYPKNEEAYKYIQKIEFRLSKEKNLQLANQMLKQNRYLEAIKYAKKVLQLERKNQKAQIIILKAKEEAKQAVEEYVQEGKKYYNQKKLNQAKKAFEAALKIDKTDNTALIYYKKIQRQLQTLESLQ